MRTRITTLVLSGLASAALVCGAGGTAFASPVVDHGAVSESAEAHGEWVDSLLRLAEEDTASARSTIHSKPVVRPALRADSGTVADAVQAGGGARESAAPAVADAVQAGGGARESAAPAVADVVKKEELVLALDGLERSRPLTLPQAIAGPEGRPAASGELCEEDGHGPAGGHGLSDCVCPPDDHGGHEGHGDHGDHGDHGGHEGHGDHGDHGGHEGHDDHGQGQGQGQGQSQTGAQDQHVHVTVVVQNAVTNNLDNSANNVAASSANNSAHNAAHQSASQTNHLSNEQSQKHQQASHVNKTSFVAKEGKPYKAVNHGGQEHEWTAGEHGKDTDHDSGHHHGELAETGSQGTPVLVGLSAALLAAGAAAMRLGRRRA
ncbi:LAETG motif-containing sortase-dependent surface protein [Kitasatospora sp. NPDC050467]|uniref:LAETG motif-containing sortase-dependent surface protein n=1 Tax=Kitasatospora sp. NPDC050467 TaxID=3364053 RepID=UPI0037BA3E59